MSKILETLGQLARPLLLAKDAPKIKIDGWQWRVHYRITALILILFSGLVSMKEYLGDNIKCVHMQEDTSDDPFIPRKMLETYCFITTTFTVPYSEVENSVMRIDRKISDTVGGPGYIDGQTKRVYHAYYQWVAFYLFFLALLFMLPHALWKALDGGKIASLVQDLNVPELPVKKSSKKRQLLDLARYLNASKGEHGSWATSYFFCEFLNILILIGVMYLTDVFLGREFSTYGSDVVKFLEEDPEDREDPMAKVFPRVTKCYLNTYGPSGTIQRFDALCVLPLNIINEKIFTFLWFWFGCTLFMTVLALIHRVGTLLSVRIRVYSLKVDSQDEQDPLLKQVVRSMGLHDWLLLYLLRENMDQITFTSLIQSIDECR